MRVTGKNNVVAVFPETLNFFFDLFHDHNGFFCAERTVDKIVLHINYNKCFHNDYHSF